MEMIATGTSAKKAAAAAAAGVVGGKAARACDGCLRRRARWYCAADDAFLCQGCDTSVHSANPLARRHERLRLHPAAASPLCAARRDRGGGGEVVVPAWFRRKARTPRGRHAKGGAAAAARALSSRRRLVVVPEAAGGRDNGEEAGEEAEAEEEQLLYRVPVFDPALAEFCSPPPSCNNEDGGAVEDPEAPPAAAQFFPDGAGHASSFEPTDAELREFAADMEALLGRGLDDGNEEDSSFYMETLGLLDPVDADDNDDHAARVKVEIDGGGGACDDDVDVDTRQACGLEMEPEASDEMLDIDFDYGSPHQESPDEKEAASSGGTASAHFLQRSLSLTLNYEAIIKSWGSSPWTGGGERPPHVKLDAAWPHDYTGMWVVGGVVGHAGAEELGMAAARLGMMGGGGGDGGREARVSRYREKRRTRLFSKKIRYEVRKLNAEKRPRMKGRFVKRATAGGSVAVAGLVA
ncbi:unnamed protein product [Urochloa humidicola]